MNSFHPLICPFLIFLVNFAAASFRSKVTSLNNEGVSADNFMYSSSIDQQQEIIRQLKSSINLLALEFESIKERFNCTKFDRDRDQWEPNGWSRSMEPRTYATGLSAPAQVDSKYIERSPRSPNNKYDNRQAQQKQPGGKHGSSHDLALSRIETSGLLEGAVSSCDRNCLDGLPGLDGAPGLDGVPGADGRNGRDGADGKDGRDGKDGQPGERGPMGPAGLQGEPGRRGRPGPPGKIGPPGQAGVCVYQAKYDCSSVALSPDGGTRERNSTSPVSSPPQPQLLMAPTMVGGGPNDSGIAGQQQRHHSEPQSAIDERQVSVNEGDNIQLSCEAFGLPKPVYVWRRSDKRLAILLEVQTGLRVTSYSGSQLPLAHVDRLQAGSYECLASNGVPPSAIKRISLDINYKPTVRLLYPPTTTAHSWPAERRGHQQSSGWPMRVRPRLEVSHGSSVLIECLVEANPSALAYWMFQDKLIMSIAAGSAKGGAFAGLGTTPTGAGLESNRRAANDGFEDGGGSGRNLSELSRKYIITESTGQLANGAIYTVLTLNVKNIGRNDTGQYKCVGKNLIDQTVGFIELSLETAGAADGQTVEVAERDDDSQAVIQLEQLDIGVGWPSHFIERNGSAACYATYGAEHRRKRLPNTTTTSSVGKDVSLMEFESMVSSFKRISMAQEDKEEEGRQPESATTKVTPKQKASETGIGGGGGLGETMPERPPQWASSGGPYDTNHHHVVDENAGAELVAAAVAGDDDLELCNFISQLPALTSANNHSVRNSAALLLDQIGKPVYVGNGPISWWSLDSATRGAAVVEAADSFVGKRREHHFVTIASRPDQLFEYATLADLQRDLSVKSSDQAGSLSLSSAKFHKLRYPIYLPGAQLINNDAFLYITHSSYIDNNNNLTHASSQNGEASLGSNQFNGTLDSLVLVVVDIARGHIAQLFRLDSDQLVSGADPLDKRTQQQQPLNLGFDFKLNRVELMADENGVWLLVPTIEKVAATTVNPRRHLVRRLHVIKLRLAKDAAGNDLMQFRQLEQLHHVSMKLDWRIIGQMFIIDGILYGIKDKHSYSTRLQFAYDLYRCKLLSSDYLNDDEPNRMFTNHFGDTQMIKYNPNEPKRLYTIDNGNLLWRPVRLIATIISGGGNSLD